MVTRNSEAVRFNIGTEQSQGSTLRDVAPNPEKFRENEDGAALDYDAGSAARMVQTVLAFGTHYAKQQLPKVQEEAYLEGAAKAGIVNSEKEIEGDIFTRGWKVGGYRDTMGRLAQANHVASLDEDLKTWREKSPEEFEKYVAARRAKLVPQLEGMTIQGRKAAFANLLMQDQAAIKKHQGEHSKYQMEVMNSSINAALRTSVGNLNNEKDDVGSYQISTMAAYSTLLDVAAQNPKLNRTMKGKYIKQAAEYALSQDHQMLYAMIMKTETELPEGGKGTLSQYLDWDDEVDLSKKHRESLNRTEAVRATKFMDDKAFMQADWDNPDTPLPSVEQVRAFAEKGVRLGFMNADQQFSFMQDFYRAGAKKSKDGPLAQMYAANDVAGLQALDKTPEEALKAWNSKVATKMTPNEKLDAMLTFGTQGRPEALREAGRMLSPAVMSLGLGGVVNPEQAAMVASVVGRLDKAEANGQTGMLSSVLSTMDEDSRTKVMYMREGIRKGLSPAVAINEAATRLVDDSKLTQPQRQAMAASSAKDDIQTMQELEPRGLFESLGLYVKSVVSTDAANQLAVRPATDWSGDQTRVNEVAAAAKLAVAEEMRVLSVSNPYLSADSRRTAALSAVAGRAIETPSGPFILPRGLTPARLFGVPASASKDSIGASIHEYLKPGDGNKMAYTVASNGQFQFKEYNGKSELVKSGVLDPKEIGKLVLARQEKQVLGFRKAYGDGSTVAGPDGSSVTFNGDNTAGVDNNLMHSIRAGLAEREGVRGKAYVDSGGSKHKDGSPVMTVGAGISSTNTHYPKSANPTKAELDRAFMLASNDAAKSALRLQQDTMLTGQSATALFTELFYQSGPGANLGALVSSMKSGDNTKAVTALHNTPAYKLAHAERKKYYDSILFNAIKGQ